MNPPPSGFTNRPPSTSAAPLRRAPHPFDKRRIPSTGAASLRQARSRLQGLGWGKRRARGCWRAAASPSTSLVESPSHYAGDRFTSTLVAAPRSYPGARRSLARHALAASPTRALPFESPGGLQAGSRGLANAALANLHAQPCGLARSALRTCTLSPADLHAQPCGLARSALRTCTLGLANAGVTVRTCLDGGDRRAIVGYAEAEGCTADVTDLGCDPSGLTSRTRMRNQASRTEIRRPAVCSSRWSRKATLGWGKRRARGGPGTGERPGTSEER